jgi:HEAT repeats
MASYFLIWKLVGYLAVVAILLNGCRPLTSRTPGPTVEVASAPAPTPSMALQAPVKPTPATNDVPTVTVVESASIEAENQLRSALAQYGGAKEETRADIEEHISQLADAGVAERDLVTTLGVMFGMENSISVKCSILNELYYLHDPSALEQVTVGLWPNQPLEVRDEAISVLQDIGDKRAIPYLWQFVADPDENIRENARDAIDWLATRGR